VDPALLGLPVRIIIRIRTRPDGQFGEVAPLRARNNKDDPVADDQVKEMREDASPELVGRLQSRPLLPTRDNDQDTG